MQQEFGSRSVSDRLVPLDCWHLSLPEVRNLISGSEWQVGYFAVLSSLPEAGFFTSRITHRPKETCPPFVVKRCGSKSGMCTGY